MHVCLQAHEEQAQPADSPARVPSCPQPPRPGALPARTAVAAEAGRRTMPEQQLSARLPTALASSQQPLHGTSANVRDFLHLQGFACPTQVLTATLCLG